MSDGGGPILSASGLTRRFQSLTAVDGVSFSAHAGDVIGLIGPNGAGKSTTLKMLSGYLQPTSGTAVICGIDVVRDPTSVKRVIGYLPEGAPAYGDMTVAGVLAFVAGVRGLDRARRRQRVDAVAAQMRLDPVMGQPVDTISKGFRRRLGIALALVHQPPLLILDEPTAGLDPNQKFEVHELLRRTALAGTTILLSTHLLDEVETLCGRAILLSGGRKIIEATPEALQARSAYHNAVVVRLSQGLVPKTMDVLRRLPRVANVARIDRLGGPREVADLLVVPQGGQSIIETVSEAIADYRLPVDELRIERGRLDDVFQQLTAVP